MSALPEAMQDIDADRLQHAIPELWNQIKYWVKVEGRDPEYIDKKVRPMFEQWQSGPHFIEMAHGATRSIYRKHQELLAAQAALEKANDDK